MRKPLTAKAVQALKPRAQAYETRDWALPGGYIVVHPSGALSYVLRYRFAGAKKKLTIGAFNPATGLGAVRAQAYEALADLAKARRDATGATPDPANAKTLARREAQEVARAAKHEAKESHHDNVEAVVQSFIKFHLFAEKRRTAAAVARVLTREVAARWTGKRLAEVTKPDIHALLDEIAERAPVQSARVFAYLRTMFRFAKSRDFIEKNLMEDIKRASAETVRDRSLVDKEKGDPRELVLVWKASETLGYPFEPIIKLLILTGARLSEIAEGKWSEIDFAAKSWTLSPGRTKNEEEHKIPLSPAVLEILNELPRRAGVDWIFSTTGKTAVSGFSRAKRNLDKALADLSDGEPIPPWRLHDIRRSVAVGLASIGVEIHVTEKILGHTSGPSSKGIIAVYQQFEYAPQKRDALNRWSDRVESAVSGADEKKIVDFPRR